MPSLRTGSSFAALSLLLTALACGDNITQGTREAQPSTIANASGTNAVAPTLDIKSSGGLASVFSDSKQLIPGATYFTLEVNGAGFTPGQQRQSRLVGVLPGGGTYSLSTSLGPTPSDGTFRAIHSETCPSRMTAYYWVVQSGDWTIESKRVAAPC